MGRFSLLTLLAIINTLTLTAFAINGDLGVSKGANGSEGQPWLIEDFADFQAFCDDEAKWAAGQYTRLEVDIDLNPDLPNRKTYSTAAIGADPNNTNKITFDGIYYAGIFDGNDHSISNFTAITNNNYVSLFSAIDNIGKIKNLSISNLNITGEHYGSNYLAGLCSINNGIITNCYVSGSLAVISYSGGLCAENYGMIDACQSSVYLTISNPGFGTSNYDGGICGRNYGTIRDSFTNSDLEGSDYGGSTGWGGICGYNQSIIDNCHSSCSLNFCTLGGGICGGNDGSITNSSANLQTIFNWNGIGGICGGNGGSISNCYATGSISAKDGIGGISGNNVVGTINNCYSNVIIIDLGGNFFWGCGGFCGFNYGTITNSYSSGTVTSEYESKIGGFCGDSFGDAIETNCYFLDTAGPDNGIGALLSDSLLKTQGSFNQWDFVQETNNGIESIWHMPYGSTGYPMLYWQRDIPGDTTGKYGVDIEDFSLLSNDWQIEYSIADLSTLASYWLEGK